MTVPEYTPILEDGASPTADERQEPSTTTNETADPSAPAASPSGAVAPDYRAVGRDDKSESVETLGRDDKTSAGAEAGAPPLSPAVGDRVGAQGERLDNDSGGSKPVKLCLHVKEDSFFCERPAVTERLYCYQHLRLRGQQMRMARARARRLACPFILPALDDLNAVKVAITQVASALTFGQLEYRRAGLLLYACSRRPAFCGTWN